MEGDGGMVDIVMLVLGVGRKVMVQVMWFAVY